MSSRILIIEDDSDIMNVLQNILIINNYEVSAITGTNDILEDIRKYRPKLVITDYLLNGMNGGKICQTIKSSPEFCELPVLLLTAHFSFARLHGNFGFDALIRKPFEIRELLNIVKTFI